MGRTKNYLRYVHESTFGLVATSLVGSSIRYLRLHGSTNRFIAVPANENVYFWDLKIRQTVNKLEYDLDEAAEVAVLECHHGGHPRTNLIAVGYANGRVRVFEYETGMLKATFTGHRTAITALAFDKSGSRLASGGKDCSIVLWDLVGERGLFSLKGHKNSISKLAFLYNDEYQKDLIISSSVDAVSSIKIWDIQLQHCFYTLPGHSSGVWSFVVLKNGTRLVTGSTGPELKVYSIEFLSESEKNGTAESLPDTFQDHGCESEYDIRIKYLGNILRNSTSISNRVQDLVVDQSETMMVCYSVDKNVEFYAIRSDDEALACAKKQNKKALKKQAKRKRQEEESTKDEDESEVINNESVAKISSLSDLDPQRLIDCEFDRKLGCQRLTDKIKSADIVRAIRKDGTNYYNLVVVTASNRIEYIDYDPKKETDSERFTIISNIESLSHRTEAQSVSISADNSLIMSASAEAAKFWRLDSKSCIATVGIDRATCCVFSNVQHISATNFKNRFALVGTRNGRLQLIDIADATVIETFEVCKDEKPLTSIFVLPDKTGIVCGGEDGVVRFYDYNWKTCEDDDGHKGTTLSLEAGRILEFKEGITCVNVSSNDKFLAVALLDSTVRVHFLDTFKYFLTMYGHKFPITSMDISDDNTLLVTGSPDKNIKIWGLDFGDCHRSIFAHQESITCVKFVPKTHYIFSCARDKEIKQWDCDHFIKIQTLKKHMAEVFTLAISPNGKYIVTSSHDRSLRMYRKTEEILVPSEEDEAERELEDEKNVFEKQDNIVLGDTNLEAGFASKMTIDTVKSTDKLIEAIDVFLNEQQKDVDYRKLCELADSKGEKRPAEPERDPLLLTAMTTDYNRFMLEVIRRVKSTELEQILITLPFDYVRKLLSILVEFLERGWDVELMVRCATFLLKTNFGQIAASPPLSQIVYRLRTIVLEKTYHLRDSTGFNLMALEHLSQHRKYHSTKVSRAYY